MELCTSQAISNLPSNANRLGFLSANNVNLLSRASVVVRRTTVSGRNNSRVLRCTSSFPRETLSEETSKEVDKKDDENSDGAISVEAVPSVDKTVTNETVTDAAPIRESAVDEPTQEFEFLDNMKLDSENTYSLLLYGGGAVVLLWFASAVIGAIDSIPLFPKLMEVVGLGFTLWFTTRYLLFKNNREELAAKIDEIKTQVLGSDED